MDYEYGIREKRSQEIQGYGMDEAEARLWMAKAMSVGIDAERIFEVIRRPIGEWEAVSDSQNCPCGCGDCSTCDPSCGRDGQRCPEDGKCLGELTKGV